MRKIKQEFYIGAEDSEVRYLKKIKMFSQFEYFSSRRAANERFFIS